MRTLDGGMTVKSRLHKGLLCGATIISLHGWAFKDLLLGRVVLYKNINSYISLAFCSRYP